MLFTQLPIDVVRYLYHQFCDARLQLELQAVLLLPDMLIHAGSLVQWRHVPYPIQQLILRAFRTPQYWSELIHALRPEEYQGDASGDIEFVWEEWFGDGDRYVPTSSGISRMSYMYEQYMPVSITFDAWILFEITKIMPPYVTDSVLCGEAQYPWLCANTRHVVWMNAIGQRVLVPPKVSKITIGDDRIKHAPWVGGHRDLTVLHLYRCHCYTLSYIWESITTLNLCKLDYHNRLNLKWFPNIVQLSIQDCRFIHFVHWEFAAHLKYFNCAESRVFSPRIALPSLTHVQYMPECNFDDNWKDEISHLQAPVLEHLETALEVLPKTCKHPFPKLTLLTLHSNPPFLEADNRKWASLFSHTPALRVLTLIDISPQELPTVACWPPNLVQIVLVSTECSADELTHWKRRIPSHIVVNC